MSMKRSGNEIRQRAAVAWHLSSRWWLVTTVLVLALTATFGSLWFWGDIEVAGETTEPYLVRDLLKDSTDIALKLAAVVGGMLAIYRYWYHRYEPLVYYVSCGLIPRTLLEELHTSNAQFRQFAQRLGLPHLPEDRRLQRWHDLPIIVLHRFDMGTLGLAEGSKVDQRFDTPDGNTVWAIAFAFSFQSTGKRHYDDWPIGLSLSLRRYFRMERPFQTELQGAKDGAAQQPPEGWFKVEVNSGGLARLHGTTKHGEALVWMASESYSLRFRDRKASDLSLAGDRVARDGRKRMTSAFGC
jgi:hypothetical protein